MILNTKQEIPKKLYVNRRVPFNGVIDTTVDTQNNIEFFLSFMKTINSHTLPTFIVETTSIDWYIEYELEKVRKEYFKDYPSRISCTFLSDNFLFQTCKHEAQVIDGSKVIKCDMTIISHLRRYPQHMANPNILHSYWKGETLAQALNSPHDLGVIWEYLIQGKVALNHIDI